MDFKGLVAAAGIVTLAACSSLERAPGPDVAELFHTEVTDQGLKQFTYTVDQGGAPRRGLQVVSRQGQSAGDREDGRGTRKERERFERQVMAWMEMQLAASGFCAHGYFIIDKNIARNTAEVRGECKSVSGSPGGAAE